MPNIMNHPLVVHARNCAKDKHEGQFRKYDGEPYFNHPDRVAKRVAQAGGTPEMVAAAYLHDTIEDTDVTFEYLVDQFGSMVALLVLELTDDYTKENYPDLNRAQRKKLEAERLWKIAPAAQTIKYCDIEDNTSDIVGHNPIFASKYLKEKDYIMKGMNKGNAELYGTIYSAIEDKRSELRSAGIN